MSEVDWSTIPGITVTSSSLALPDCERDGLNKDVAEIIVGNRFVIDVEWSIDQKAYLITMYTDNIETPIIPIIVCKHDRDIEMHVRSLAERYSDIDNQSIFASASDDIGSEYEFDDKSSEDVSRTVCLVGVGAE